MGMPIWILILIIIFVLLFLFLITYLIFKTNKSKKIKDELEKINKINDAILLLNINKKFENLKEYKVTNKINDIVSNEIEPKLSIFNATYDNNISDLKDAKDLFYKSKVFKLQDKVITIRKNFKNNHIEGQKVLKLISEAFEEERDNKEIIDLLKLKLHSFENTYLNSEDIFYYDELNTRFSLINEKYDSVEKNKDIDYDVLVNTSREIYEELKVLEDKVISYPNMYKNANNLYNKLIDLNNLHEKLTMQNYNLQELDFDNKFEIISKSLENFIKRLIILDDINEYVLDQCENFIKDVYLRFEEEISAKENINRMMSTSETTVKELEKQQVLFNAEYNKIIKYELGTQTKDNIKLLLESNDKYIERYYILIDILGESTIDYSTANDDFTDIYNNLTSNLSKTINYINKFKKIRKDEISATKQLNEIRQIQNDNICKLLGFTIKENSLEKLKIASNVSIKKLESELNTKKINIDNVNNELSNAITKINLFQKEIDKNTRLQKISRYALIYSNKYRDKKENILALNMSKKFINQGMFHNALENIYNVVSQFEDFGNINNFIKSIEKVI